MLVANYGFDLEEYMKKGVVTLLICLSLTALSYAKYSGGDGSTEYPFKIATPNDLNSIGDHSEDWDEHFKLVADINLSAYGGETFNIIGGTFSGVFDGNGHTISNFTYTYSGIAQKKIGIFGYVDGAAAEIKNLTVVNPDINGGANGTAVGAIAGYFNNGTIRNCTVTGGSVRGTWPTGGLAGTSRGQIIDCHADTEVWGEIWSGGLVGSAWSGLIQNCGTIADVHGVQYVGGLVGENGGEIIACFATGAIDGNDSIGGLVGENNGTISQSYATGEVVAARYNAGGFTGRNVGGTIYDCYANGKVSADDNAGGFASLNWDGTISNCYSIGYVDATYFRGGFLQHDIDGLTSDCFWDTLTSGTTISAGGTGKTTTEMKTASTFTSAGWDFTTPVWRIEEGKDYPRMIWQPHRNKCFYVDPNTTGTANGSSWQNAFHYLQDAVEAAAKAFDVNEIRVAAGIYRPDRTADLPLGTGDRGASFKLIEGIRITGGYAGFGKPDPNARDVELYQSILSGDLLVNDTAVTDACDLNNDPNRAENSYSVVSSMGISSSAVLDGFTITGGNANGTGDWPVDCGGGMFIQYGNPQIRNCKFVHNLTSTSGAGMYIMVSNCSISGCEFNSNFLAGANVQPCGGGALGVMWSDDLAVTIKSCRFIQNKSYEWGGAISNFWSNLEITDCVFSRNVTYDSNDSWSSAEGGGIFSIGGKLVLQNCLFSANAAIGESFFTTGGAMNFGYKCEPVLQNCIFVDNSASFTGGGIYGYPDMNTITLQNCIFWNNTDKDGAVESAQIDECNDIIIDYSCVQNWTGTLGGVGNIDADPCFVRPGHWNTNDTPGDTNDDFWVCGDYHLKSEAGRWQPSIYADLDPTADRFINLSDFAAFAGSWREKGSSIPADMDNNGVVYLSDLALLLDSYLTGYTLAAWVPDEMTSPCIDAGDPNSDWTAELWPHGKRINMGVYGGTPQASMSLFDVGNIANLDYDPADEVDFNDFRLFVNKWLKEEILIPEDLNRDGVVNFFDYAIFAGHWLESISP
jgi:hypothetical protein